MKITLTISFCFVLVLGISQSKWNTPKHNFSIFSLEVNNKYFHDDFGGNLKQIENLNLNSLNLESISLSSIDNARPISRKMNLPGYIKFSYLIPKEIVLSDSTKQNFRGFNFTFSVWGQNVFSEKNFSLFFTEGFNIGRLKLVNTQKQKMKNMVIAPYVGLVTRLSISKFNLFAIAQYDYDISSKMWKKQWFHKGQDIHIPGIRQSGLTFSAGVGFSLGN